MYRGQEPPWGAGLARGGGRGGVAAAVRGGVVRVPPSLGEASSRATLWILRWGGRCLPAHLNGGTRREGRRADPATKTALADPPASSGLFHSSGLAGVPDSPTVADKPSSRGPHNSSVPADVPLLQT